MVLVILLMGERSSLSEPLHAERVMLDFCGENGFGPIHKIERGSAAGATGCGVHPPEEVNQLLGPHSLVCSIVHAASKSWRMSPFVHLTRPLLFGKATEAKHTSVPMESHNS